MIWKVIQYKFLNQFKGKTGKAKPVFLDITSLYFISFFKFIKIQVGSEAVHIIQSSMFNKTTMSNDLTYVNVNVFKKKSITRNIKESKYS